MCKVYWRRGSIYKSGHWIYILIPFAQKYYFEENLNSKYLQNNPHAEKSEQKPNSMSQDVCDDFCILTKTEWNLRSKIWNMLTEELEFRQKITVKIMAQSVAVG